MWYRSLMLFVEEEDKMNDSSDVASSKGSCGQDVGLIIVVMISRTLSITSSDNEISRYTPH